MEWYLMKLSRMRDGRVDLYALTTASIEFYSDSLREAMVFKTKADAIIYSKGMQLNWKPIASNQIKVSHTPSGTEFRI